MQIELNSRTKLRDGGRLADDVVLVVPGLVAAVFDGATDPTGSNYGGLSSGRIAAASAAQCLAELVLAGGADIPVEELAGEISEAIAAASRRFNVTHPPSTTMAAAIRTGGRWRLSIVGDSGIRVNGRQLLHHEKLIDEVSTRARLVVRRCLAARGLEGDALEMACRAVSFHGLAQAFERGDLDAADVELVHREVGKVIGERADAADIAAFVDGGILTQQGFANIGSDHPLGFATLNGTRPSGFGMSDTVLAEDEVETLELFTDGYFDLPAGLRISDWEARFAQVEEEDPSKIGPFASVKGSTSLEFSDDRSVICLWR